MLYLPDRRKGYYLETDASNYALGAVPYQLNDKKEKKIITLASCTLKGPDLTYFPTGKELLAIVWALEKFRTNLHGAQIMNRTDHLALTFKSMQICKCPTNTMDISIKRLQNSDRALTRKRSHALQKFK